MAAAAMSLPRRNRRRRIPRLLLRFGLGIGLVGLAAGAFVIGRWMAIPLASLSSQESSPEPVLTASEEAALEALRAENRALRVELERQQAATQEAYDLAAAWILASREAGHTVAVPEALRAAVDWPRDDPKDSSVARVP